MRLLEAVERLEQYVNIPLGEWMTPEQLEGIIINKGKTGQLLEIALGLENTSCNLDFEDGELKTNKCDRNGNPKETMYITQISSMIDDLLNSRNFYETRLYEKIDNLLYVPISKDGRPEQWFFLPHTHINLQEHFYNDLKAQLERDYYDICEHLVNHIENGSDGYIHTSNGKFIQIRSKDSKPYHPIFSNTYNRFVSNKNHAFYFKKDYMRYITDTL
jgi:DNA mismatch repair protein MutH